MRFRYLANLGSAYDYEQGTRGHRGAASFAGIVSKLAKAKADLAAALASPAPGGSGPKVAPIAARSNVAALRAFHQGQANTAKDVDQSRIAELRKEVQRLRSWITTQGLTLDKNDNILWHIDTATVVYDHDLVKQGMTRIWLSGGRMFLDQACRTPLDTERMVTHFSGPGYGIFVMSKNGQIHVDSHKVGNRHHSSLLAGGKVAGAGELKVSNGYLKLLSNKSGHYRPNPDHLLQIIHMLDKAGVNGDYKVVLSASTARTFGSVRELLEFFELDGQDSYDLNKLFTYQHHFTSQSGPMMADKGWQWRTDPTTQAPGFYDAAGTLVPHKQVRAWFKARGLTANTVHHHS